MSFGGFFGGGSGSSSNNNDNNNGSSSSSSSSSSSFPSNPFSSSSSSSSSSPSSSSSAFSSNESTTIKRRIQSDLQIQVATQNARALISKVNEVCFAHCVTYPGPSLSSKEQSCLSSCMEKYIDGWNTVNRTYSIRLQREGANISGFAGPGAAAGGGGKEMF